MQISNKQVPPLLVDSEEPPDLHVALSRALSKAAQQLELTWNPPGVPFFLDVHEQVVKVWSAPQRYLCGGGGVRQVAICEDSWCRPLLLLSRLSDASERREEQ